MSSLPSLPARLPDDTKTNIDLTRRLAPDTLLAGRYRIISQIGMGGMGVVYKALDEELGTDIALKVLRPDLGTDPEWIQRLRRELVLAREVTHRNAVRIHDIGESDGLRFLTMGLVEGRSLHDVLEDGGPLSVDRALKVVRQVAEALQQAHDVGIVHRDLKPGNILLAPDDTAYITDFGVARSLDGDDLSHSGAIVGTLDYLSPEQAAGVPVDARSDIYALGIVLFEMLSGQLPFQARTKAEALAQRITGRVRDISESGVRVPGHVRSAIRRCLERRPARRYASVRELLADLDRQATGLGEGVRRPAAVVLVTLALATIGSGAAYRRWTHEPTPVPAPVAAPAPASVAVLPLSDETGDPSLAWTATGVAEMLATHLAETPQLRVVDPARVQRTLRDLKLAHPGGDEAALRQLAGLLDVDNVVTGAVRRAGKTLRLDLRLVSVSRPRGAPPLVIGAQTSDPGGLFGLVGEAGDGLRGELGAAPEGRAPEPQTTSLEAAKAYREGRERLVVGDSVGAKPAFERAVRADPRFAAALLGLSEAEEALGHQDKAVGAAERAVQVVGSAESRLAWRLRAHLALLNGDPAEGERAYAGLVRRYPNDTEALLGLAAAQSGQGAIARAVVTLKRVTELDKGDPRGWFLLGKNMILSGDARQAVTDPLVRALALMTGLRNEQGEADVLNAMGVAHQRLGEYPQAIARYGEAAALRKKVGDERGMAVSLRNRGSIHLAMGRPGDAEPDLRAARELYRRLGDRKGLADVSNDFGALHEGRGEYPAALRDYQEALRLRRDLGDEQQLAQSYDNIGYVFFLQGAHDNALAYWRQGLELRQKLGDKPGVVLSTQNLGFLQMARGQWSQAMKSFLDALEKAREIEFANAVAVSHGNIAQLHQYEGRYPAALLAYDEALKVLKSLDDKRGLAEFTIKEATALIELGRFDEAKAKLDVASPWVGETGNLEQAADFQAALGDYFLARGDRKAARKTYGRAVELATASRSPAAILRARVARGAGGVASGDAAGSMADLASAARAADELGDVLVRIRAAEALARAELALGRYPEAETSVQTALAQARACGWEAGLYRLQALLGAIREARGDAPGAAAAYRESARRLARLRGGLSAPEQASLGGLEAVRRVEAWLGAHAR